MLQLAVQPSLICNIAFYHVVILHFCFVTVKVEKNSGGFFLLEI